MSAKWLTRRWVRWVAVALVLVVALLGLATCRGRKVAAANVERKAIVETLVVNGRVLARSKAEIGSPIAGTVAAIHVREGDRVQQGALLVSLIDREESAEAQRAHRDGSADRDDRRCNVADESAGARAGKAPADRG